MSDPAEPASPDAESRWHAMDGDAVLAAVEGSAQGLNDQQVDKRRRRFGGNVLPQGGRRGGWARLLAQFNSMLIYVLLGSAGIAGALGHHIDGLVILGVVILNALVGYVQEGRAERALDAIRNLIAPRATVLRDGHRRIVASADLVPGDIVLLESGDRVPADLRLLRARALRVDESLLTGESLVVDKREAPGEAQALLADRVSMAYSGTMVAAGQGTGVVVATGTASEVGRIGALLQSVESLETPLVRQMDRFARQLSVIILTLAASIFAYAVWIGDYAVAEAFMAVVALTVAAIPEGLPAVMTITLAVGVQRMAARNVIIRRLPAVETLGSVTVICSDKTGTLTRNEMTVRRVVTAEHDYAVSGGGYDPHGGLGIDGCEFETLEDPVALELARAALLCNDASLRRDGDEWTVLGDPMEGALVTLGMKAGFEPASLRRELPRDDEIPFDAAHRFMATLHHSHEGGVFAYIKGAPERVLQMCASQMRDGHEAPLDPAYWEARSHALAGQGQRILAVAVKRHLPVGPRMLRFEDLEQGAVLIGLVGIMDPPRDEAITAVADCRQAGITAKMITGDHVATAAAIAAQLGMVNHDGVVSGADIDAASDDELREMAGRAAVFARTTPEHKLRLVNALQARGEVVAMTGDGVNDAPALRRADIGVAMGYRGTEAAKQAAETVLADDNFASVVAAVREGRTVYDNIKKVIAWTLPTSFGEAFAIITAILFGLTLPVTPLQILWINMVTVVALGLTLAFEPTAADVMRRRPRGRGERLLSGGILWRTLFVSALFVAGVFGMFEWALWRGLPLDAARTIVVNTLVMFEVCYLYSVRSPAAFSWRAMRPTRAIVVGVVGIMVAQAAMIYLPPLQHIFATRALPAGALLAILGAGLGLLLVMELEKWLLSRFVRRSAVNT